MLPLFYVFMESRSREAYNHVFAAIKRVMPHLRPQFIMTDFERAAQSALRDIFTNAFLQGCLFHHVKVSYIIIQYIYIYTFKFKKVVYFDVIFFAGFVKTKIKLIMKQKLKKTITKLNKNSIRSFFLHFISSKFKRCFMVLVYHDLSQKFI